MSSTPSDSQARFRKNVQDVAVFGVAVALSVGAVFTYGLLGLAAGCVLLSLAAGLVVGREDGRAEAMEKRAMLADGGQYED